MSVLVHVPLLANQPSAVDIANSVLLSVVRCIYSMPPAHGAALVETILKLRRITSSMVWRAKRNA